MKDEAQAAITKLIEQAKNATDSHEAMRYSQAATNIANAFATFQHGSELAK